MAKCITCGKGNLKIMGTSGLGDLIEVECDNPECGDVYDVEPDGLGEGGMEFVEARMKDMENVR